MIAALVLLLSISAGAQAAGASQPPDPAVIRVHVKTSDAGDPSDLAERRESVKHLAAAITAKKKSGLLVVADDDNSVDVVVEIEERTITVPKVVIGLSGGMGAQAGRPAPAPATVKAVQLRATIAIARNADPTEMANKNRANDSESGWKSAADDLAKQVEKWIADHRAAILAARGKT